MVVARPSHQRLAARDDDSEQGDWGPMQIATPAIVGGVLLLAFAVYVIWKRRPTRIHAYHQVQTNWAAKIERIFIPRRKKRRAVPPSVRITLDDSMRMPTHRSDSSDSQTPLTSTHYSHSDYPHVRQLSDSPPPVPKRTAVRWWWFFGSRPREVKSEEPGTRWRIDGPDGSSTGHGHSSHGHDEYRARYVGYLETMQEDAGEDGDIGATPTRPVREMSIVQDRAGSFVTRTPVLTAVALPRSSPGTPTPPGDRGLPPSYDVSRHHTLLHQPSVEAARIPHSKSYTVLPPPLRTAGYSSPRSFHGRELSSDNFLAAQSPIATTVF